MKRFVFAFTALTFFTLGAYAFNYNNNCPPNTFGGRVNLYNTTPTANGSAQAYQDMYNREYYGERYSRPHKHRLERSLYKQRKHNG